MTMKELRVNFSDFWHGFNKEDNLFIHLLRKHYNVVLSDNPDVLIYSCYSFNYMKYDCYKIFYTGENIRPNYRECDFALSFDYESYGNKNLRLPLYRWRADLEGLTAKKDIDKILAEKKKFCCMLVSNPSGKERNLFFEKLSKYKKVDSGGKHLNNIGGMHIADKIQFIKQYKFTMSFENASYPGYTTEKLVEPMTVNSVPIYWGNPLVAGDFNAKSFINLHDYNSFDEAIERIIEIDNNEDLYKKYLEEPYFDNNIFPSSLDWNILSGKLQMGIEEMLSKDAIGSSMRSKWYSIANKTRRNSLAKLYGRAHWDY
jgi:hypothetical protein